MKRYLSILLLCFSCAHGPKDLPQTRELASVDSCTDLISIYFNINKSSSTKISADNLLQRGRIERADFQILKHPKIVDFLSDREDKIEIAANLTLIKNKFKHFDEERIIRHYLFLENSCGI